MLRPGPRSARFPYATLCRSRGAEPRRGAVVGRDVQRVGQWPLEQRDDVHGTVAGNPGVIDNRGAERQRGAEAMSRESQGLRASVGSGDNDLRAVLVSSAIHSGWRAK